MSVTVDVQLPAQGPGANDFTEMVPLGGNGFRAPFACQRIRLQSTGDASAGTNFLIARMDPQYSQVVSWISLSQTNSTPIQMQAGVWPKGSFDFFVKADNMDGYAGSSAAFSREMTWAPMPIILETDDAHPTNPAISCEMANTNSQTFQLTAEIFLFDKRARESGHAGDMLAFIGRAGFRTFTHL